MRKCWHQFRITGCGRKREPFCFQFRAIQSTHHILTKRHLFEIAAVETLIGRGTFFRVVHEEEIQQPYAGHRQPWEFLFDVIVRLLLERDIFQGRHRCIFRPNACRRCSWRTEKEIICSFSPQTSDFLRYYFYQVIQ